MYTLTTLHALRLRLNLAPSDTADDARLIDALESAAAGIERAAGRRFCPRRAALAHDYTSPVELLLDDDLLDLTALAITDGAAIPLADVLRLPAEPPAAVLRLTGSAAFSYTRSSVAAITVTGIWGWHDRWLTAWRDTADTVRDAPLTAAAATLTVLDADGPDRLGEFPRFQVGHLLRIDDEYLRVLAVNAVANTLTVQRGAQGTAPAAHNQGARIDTYQPPADVAALALRWAAWLYREADLGVTPTPLPLLEAAARLHRPRVKA